MIRFFILSLVLLFPMTAKADYFLWEDPKSGLTLTFPDTWKTTSNTDKDDIITLLGPDTNGFPKCVVKASDDKRYTIFPPRYGRSIQKKAVSESFWNAYLGEYQDYSVVNVIDDAGVGRWNASYAIVGYTNYDGEVFEKRRAIMFGSLYFDTMYTVECSALEHAYERWHLAFVDIIKSIDFQKMHHELPTGHYRDFLQKADQQFWYQGRPDGVVKY